MEMLPQQHAHHTCNQHTHELHTVPASSKSCLSAFKADLRTDAGILASPHHCAGPARPHCSLPCWCVCVSASASFPTQSVPGRVAPLHHCFPQTLRWCGSKPFTPGPSWWVPLEASSLSSLLSCGFSHSTSNKASSSHSQVARMGLAVPDPLPGTHWDLRTSDFALLEISLSFLLGSLSGHLAS